jgi:hypothetical protein
VPVVLAAALAPEKTSKTVNEYYSYFNFWLENIIFLGCFFIYELLLVVPVYLKNIIVMGAYTYGMFASLARMMLWVLIGLPYSFVMVLWDVHLLFQILKMHEGCKAVSGDFEGLEKEELDEDVRIKICV